jgi:hypothetical protein
LDCVQPAAALPRQPAGVDKLTDPAAAVAPQPGDVLKLSKKHAVRFV